MEVQDEAYLDYENLSEIQYSYDGDYATVYYKNKVEAILEVWIDWKHGEQKYIIINSEIVPLNTLEKFFSHE